jgi:DNA-binding response OmpR family regulator
MPTFVAAKQVLVIDDDSLLNESLQRKFRKLGFETTGAFDGKRGLELMRSQRYDGIVLDLRLPLRVTQDRDGFDILSERAATVNADTPMFVLTSMDDDNRDRARELGARWAFNKLAQSPLDVAAFVAKDLNQA